MIEKVNIKEKLSEFTEHWVPKIIGELNGQCVKLVKFKGDYIWHIHKNEDELFLTIKGWMDIELRDKTITLEKGEFVIIPRGVEHKPVAIEECHALLFEPATTRNTGNFDNKYTIEPDNLDKI